MPTETSHVFARKYRPQTLVEVVGQDAVTVTLKNALKKKKIAHAYLFTGSRGIGKTSVARILAKALNCQKGISPEPCGECVSCREIATSSSLDVLEMDAASNTGVDNVREAIIETVGLAPSRDRYKVFIIDEAHMLSAAAFNALLKTLEEPPSYVVFILATTESPKIPATIASRCQRFRFRPLPVLTLVEHLGGIAKREKISAEPEALRQLSVAAEGSLRDAVGLLDQCRSFSDGPVTEASVREMFGLAPRELIRGLSEGLVDRDASAVAGRLQEAYAQGVDLTQLLRDLRLLWDEIYRDRLGVEPVKDEVLQSVAKKTTAAAAGFILRRLNDALNDMRFTDSPRLVCELALFGCLESAADLSQWIERLETLEKRLESGGAAPATSPQSFSSPKPAASMTAASVHSPAPAPVQPASQLRAAAGGETSNFLPALIAAVRSEKSTLAAALQNARAMSESGGTKLLFSRSFDFEIAKRNTALIEAKLATILGRPAPIALELTTASAVDAPEAGLSAKSPSPDSSAPAASAAPAGTQAPTALQKAQEILGGKIKVVKKKQ